MSIRSKRRNLTVELPLDGTEPAPETLGPAWSRSGGWSPTRVGHRARASSLLVVTSRLDFEPAHQQETLLAVNGFHLIELLDDIDEPELVPALEALALDRSSSASRQGPSARAPRQAYGGGFPAASDDADVPRQGHEVHRLVPRGRRGRRADGQALPREGNERLDPVRVPGARELDAIMVREIERTDRYPSSSRR